MYAGINQKAAPIRLLFLVQPDRHDRFERAMQLAYSLWGGTYAPILSYYEELPVPFRYEFRIGIPVEEYFSNTIGNYDPDLVLYDEDIPQDRVKTIAGDREISTIPAYLATLRNHHFDQSISLMEIAAFLLKQEFKFLRNDDLVPALPKIDDADLVLKAFLGDVPTFVREEIRAIFGGNDVLEEPEVSWATLDNYRNDPKIDILHMNRYKLRSWGNKNFKRGSAIYMMRSSRLQDVQNFWNLRAAGWQVVPLPVDLADEPAFKSLVEKFTEWETHKHNGDHTMINRLVAAGLTEQEVEQAWQKVIPDITGYKKQIMFSYQTWFPRYWASYRIQDADMIKSQIPFYDSNYDHYEPEEGRVEFKPLNVPFIGQRNLSRESAYKIIIELSINDENSKYAEVLHGIDTRQLRRLTAAIDFRTWRLSNTGIHRFVHDAEDNIRFSLPEALPFFSFYFSNKGFKLKETSNSKLAKEVLKNIGGLTYGKFFLQTGPLKIIELFEGGKEITYAQLVSEIKQQLGFKNKDETKHFISRLLEHRIVEMGAIIQCEVCDQHGFFLPSHLQEQITCPICRNQFHLPMSEPSSIAWAYRGIGPFTRTNKADGVMAVFATLGFFHREFADTRGKISALFGFELGKKEQQEPAKEVDLALLLRDQHDEDRNPDLLFCECKTYKHFTEKDIERMKLLGDQFPNAVLIFATLNQRLEETERVMIAQLTQYFQHGNGDRPLNSVMILTGSEVLAEDFDQLAAYKTQLRPYNRYNDFLASICEFSVERHLKIENWWQIKDRQWQESIYRRGMIQNIMLGLKLNAASRKTKN